MRTPRRDNRPSKPNVVSMRDWQKLSGQKPVPPKPPRDTPLWALWVVLALTAAAISWYQGGAVGPAAAEAPSIATQ